jgi:NADPH2 dehydrogenase
MDSDKKKFPPIARFKKAAEFAVHFAELSGRFGIALECDDGILKAPESPLAQPIAVGDKVLGNRFAIHPMEGWDGLRGGGPSDWTLRRWRNFGLSGAKLIWGGEAVAVSPEGRANPNQLYYAAESEKGLAALLDAVRCAHREAFGSADDLVVGLQLTHSGRFCRPNEWNRGEPRIVHRHPVLDRRIAGDAAAAMISDAALDDLIEKFLRASVAAQKLGFDFVDIKHCHGYLLHELLAAKTREGNYGGSFENRTRFLREVIAGIRRDAPGLAFGVRLSAFDWAPRLNEEKAEYTTDDFTFGALSEDLRTWRSDEPLNFLKLCRELGAIAINITGGSPYYSAHMQRPAAYPPVDSAERSQDPLIGVARQLQIAAECKRAVPELPLVGTAYSYLQEFLPHVAQAQVRAGHVDFVGLGRVVLSYPTLPADVLQRGELTRNRICRTFSDCTNGPRMGFISGCYPLDPAYKTLPEWKQIQARKKELEKV